MRVFLAVSPPEAVRATIASWVERLRAHLPPARWVRAENLHLTLLFLGETEAAAIADLTRSLAGGLEGRRRFTARFTGLGGFPARGPVRVVWLGLEPEWAIAEVAEAAIAAAGQANLTFDRRPFHPHLTLARCTSPWPVALRDRLGETALAPPPLEFQIESVELVASELAAGGSRYTVLASLPLEAAA